MMTPKRQVVAQFVVCQGCCCGRTDRGKPPVPVDWLRAEWKRRRMIGNVGLSTSDCLGPCDVLNVVTVVARDHTIWLGGFNTQAQYEALTDWASESATAGYLLPLPRTLRAHVFERFRPEQASALSTVSDRFKPQQPYAVVG